MNFQPSDDYSSDHLIGEFKSIETLEEQLKFVLLHLYSLKQETQEQFRSQIIEYERLLQSPQFRRAIKYRDSLLKDYASEYMGKDFGDDDPFVYNEKLETEIIKIEMKLLATIGLIAKSMKEKGVFIGDEA